MPKFLVFCYLALFGFVVCLVGLGAALGVDWPGFGLFWGFWVYVGLGGFSSFIEVWSVLLGK